MRLCRVVFYVNSIVWWQLLGKEAIDWQGTWVSSFAKYPQPQVLCYKWHFIPGASQCFGRGQRGSAWDRAPSSGPGKANIDS